MEQETFGIDGTEHATLICSGCGARVLLPEWAVGWCDSDGRVTSIELPHGRTTSDLWDDIWCPNCGLRPDIEDRQ